jgi:hypothetical protein
MSKLRFRKYFLKINKKLSYAKNLYPKSYVIIQERFFLKVLIHNCKIPKDSALEYFNHEKEHMDKI